MRTIDSSISVLKPSNIAWWAHQLDRAIYPGGPAHCGRRLCPYAGQDLRADDDAAGG